MEDICSTPNGQQQCRNGTGREPRSGHYPSLPEQKPGRKERP
jgi:hypothetical protein